MKIVLKIHVSIRITWINIIKGEGLYQNKVKSGLVCTRHCKMDYFSLHLLPGWGGDWFNGVSFGHAHEWNQRDEM